MCVRVCVIVCVRVVKEFELGLSVCMIFLGMELWVRKTRVFVCVFVCVCVVCVLGALPNIRSLVRAGLAAHGGVHSH